MQTTPAIQHIAACTVRKDHHLAGDVPAPVGGALDCDGGRAPVDVERMQSSIAIEYQPATAIGQEGKVASDIPAWPVGGVGDRDRRAVWVHATPAIEDCARLG